MACVLWTLTLVKKYFKLFFSCQASSFLRAIFLCYRFTLWNFAHQNNRSQIGSGQAHWIELVQRFSHHTLFRSWRRNSAVQGCCEHGLWLLCVFYWGDFMYGDCSGPTGGAKLFHAVLLHVVQLDPRKPEAAFQSWAWVGHAAWYRGDSHGVKWHGALCPPLMSLGPSAGSQDPGHMSAPGRIQHMISVIDSLPPTANVS